MELTIALSVPESSEDMEILETLESLPWDTSGVDLIVYSQDTGRIKKVISEGDLETTIRDGEMSVTLCETQEPEETYHTIGLEDTKTEEVMFLKAGDVIEDFQGDILTTAVSGPLGFPGIGKEGTPETAICYDSRCLPMSYRGIVFRASFLRGNNFSPIDDLLPAKVCNHLKDKISSPDYWSGWGDYDISESLSVERAEGDEEKILHGLEGIWRGGGLSWSPYLRDLVWARMTTAAANLMPPSDFKKYLYPAKKTDVLK